MKNLFVLLCVPVCLLSGNANASWITTDLGSFAGTSVSVSGLSANGIVIGTAQAIGSTDSRAFESSNHGLLDLGTLGGNQSQANGVNSNGQVVGWSTTADGAQHAFFYGGHGMEDIGTLGGPFSEAIAINEAGQIAGSAGTNS